MPRSITAGRPTRIGHRDLLVDRDLHGAQHPFVLAFGVDDPAALGRHLARCREDRLHQRAAVIDELLQALAVSLQIADRPSGRAGFHRGPGNRRRDLDDQARIERLRNDVIRTEAQVLDAAVGRGHDIALLLARKLGDCMHRRDFHRPGDGRGADIQCAAKNERKAQDIVHLIRVIAAARGDHGIVPHAPRLLGEDLRDRIGERQYQGSRCHPADHVLREHAARRESQKHVRPADDLTEVARLGGLRESGLFRVHQFLPARIDDPRQDRRARCSRDAGPDRAADRRRPAPPRPPRSRPV